MVEVLNKNTMQGSIKKFTFNRVPFEAWPAKSKGGGKGGGEKDRLSGVRHGTKDHKLDRTRSNIRKTKGNKNLGGNKKLKGAKSKAGKKPAVGESDSSQWDIRNHFRSLARPEEIWISPGNSLATINTSS